MTARLTDEERHVTAAAEACGWWVGPVWKLGGETCVCYLPTGHALPHKCECGSWFQRCGRPSWWHE